MFCIITRKMHWMEKLCNKLKKPMGEPGIPVHNRILCCQWIHNKILAKSSSIIMGAASDEDNISPSGDEDEDDKENNEEEEEEMRRMRRSRTMMLVGRQ
jgi:hypothetical protein